MKTTKQRKDAERKNNTMKGHGNFRLYNLAAKNLEDV